MTRNAPLYLGAVITNLYATTVAFVLGMGIGISVGWLRSVKVVPLARFVDLTSAWFMRRDTIAKATAVEASRDSSSTRSSTWSYVPAGTSPLTSVLTRRPRTSWIAPISPAATRSTSSTVIGWKR